MVFHLLHGKYKEAKKKDAVVRCPYLGKTVSALHQFIAETAADFFQLAYQLQLLLVLLSQLVYRLLNPGLILGHRSEVGVEASRFGLCLFLVLDEFVDLSREGALVFLQPINLALSGFQLVYQSQFLPGLLVELYPQSVCLSLFLLPTLLYRSNLGLLQGDALGQQVNLVNARSKQVFLLTHSFLFGIS